MLVLARLKNKEVQVSGDDISSTLESNLREEVDRLKAQLNDKEVALIDSGMRLNENEGLIQALQLHNDALLERVQFLAARVETLTFQSRHVESLKEEFYQHCREYIDKKRQMGNSQKEAREMLEIERKEKENMRSQMGQMQAFIDQMRQEISSLMEELGNKNRAK